MAESDNDEDIECDIHRVISKEEFGKLRFGNIHQAPVHQPAKLIRPFTRYVLHLNLIHTVYNTQQSQSLIGFFIYKFCSNCCGYH